MQYNGIPIVRVESFDSSKPTFFVGGLKSLDHQAILSEMKDGTTVILSAMVESIRKVRELLDLSKSSGVWQRK
jgi:hypothetical protein